MTKIIFCVIVVGLVTIHINNGLTVSTKQYDVEDEKDEMLGTSGQASNKGHILFFHNAGTMSHLNVVKALAQGLLDNGHKVTTAFYGKTKIVHENYTEIFIKDRYAY